VCFLASILVETDDNKARCWDEFPNLKTELDWKFGEKLKCDFGSTSVVRGCF
jgi:hypothetical protein